MDEIIKWKTQTSNKVKNKEVLRKTQNQGWEGMKFDLNRGGFMSLNAVQVSKFIMHVVKYPSKINQDYIETEDKEDHTTNKPSISS